MNQNPNNKLISKKRGPEWKKSLISGRVDSIMRPTYLKIIRSKYQHPQSEVASNLKLTVSTYAAIERGQRSINLDRAKKILSHFGLKPLSFKKYFKETRENRFIAKKVIEGSSKNGK